MERIIHLYEVEKRTLAEIARELGVSKQTISQRLIAAGHSPAARDAKRRETSHTSQFRRQRTQRIETKARLRELRVERLQRECAALEVRPYTLAQYVTANGPYASAGNGDGNHYGKGKLPPRHTVEGQALAQHLIDLCAPWHPATLARIAAKRA